MCLQDVLTLRNLCPEGPCATSAFPPPPLSQTVAWPGCPLSLPPAEGWVLGWAPWQTSLSILRSLREADPPSVPTPPPKGSRRGKHEAWGGRTQTRSLVEGRRGPRMCYGEEGQGHTAKGTRGTGGSGEGPPQAVWEGKEEMGSGVKRRNKPQGQPGAGEGGGGDSSAAGLSWVAAARAGGGWHLVHCHLGCSLGPLRLGLQLPASHDQTHADTYKHPTQTHGSSTHRHIHRHTQTRASI